MSEVANTTETAARPGLIVDGRGEAARARLLGLRGYERALLAAKHAGLAPLVLWVESSQRDEVAAFLQDPRLAPAEVEVVDAKDALPPLVRVDGGAVFDKGAAAALVAGRDPSAGGLFLGPNTPGTKGKLLRSLENPCDGLVDTWLNRPLSRLMTQALLPTGISPNAVTVGSFLIGVAGVVLIALRRYELAIAGALLFQLSAAVDCVDGEIARLTYRFSPLGARLDLALDNVVHVLLFLALGWAAVPLLGTPLALGLGASAALGGAISFLIVYRLTFRSGPRPEGDRVQRFLDKITNRDFSLLVIAAACAGRIDLLLWLLGTGTHVFWLLLLWVSCGAATAETGSPETGSPETGSPETGSPETGAPEAVSSGDVSAGDGS